MIGIVLVSHSPELANAAYGLARQMVPGDGPRVAIAAGAGEGVTGTDAFKVSEAIAEAASPDGVLVFMDLGSAVLSAEMALEFVTTGDMPVKLTSAPFVEGLLAGLVRAAGGGTLDQVEREARDALSAKSSQLADEPERDAEEPGTGTQDAGAHAAGAHADPSPVHPEVTAELVLTNPDGMHARPAALVVAALGGLDATVGIENRRTGAIIPDASSMTSLLTLGARAGDELRVFATGRDADQAVAALRELVLDGFGENAPPAATESGTTVPSAQRLPQPSGAPAPGAAAPGAAAPGAAAPAAAAPAIPSAEASRPEASRPEASRPGVPIGVSPGRVAGLIARMPDPVTEPPATGSLTTEEREREADRIGTAAGAVERALTDRSAQASRGRAAGEARTILEATALIAADHAFVDAACARVRDYGERADRAVWESMSGIAGQLAAQGGRMAERASDVRDVRDRIVAELQGVRPPGVPVPDHPFILIAQDLAPADTALLDPSRCIGIVTVEGGPTSHTAILARSLGIPAVVAAPAALSLEEGTTVLVDGTTGEIVPDPTPGQIAAVSAIAAVAPFDGRGRTSDGHWVEILANVASPESVADAVAAQAEGVGLFRTEFSFLDRETAPSVEEQTSAYRTVLAGFPGHKVVVRTLDAGADKPLPFLTDTAEANPALGIRGYRTSWRRPEVLDQQLEAIAAAGRAEPAEVWVMAPMIDTAAEARDFVDQCRRHGLERAGVMIETPAAALTAAEMFEVVDFVSLGTNDLAQYTMAADRLLGDLASLNDAWQPAVLRLIGMVGAAGAAAGKPVGVCGEAGADASLAPVLAGLGVTSLSMTPRAIDAVADRLRDVSWDQCRRAADLATSASSAADARRAVSGFLADQG